MYRNVGVAGVFDLLYHTPTSGELSHVKEHGDLGALTLHVVTVPTLPTLENLLYDLGVQAETVSRKILHLIGRRYPLFCLCTPGAALLLAGLVSAVGMAGVFRRTHTLVVGSATVASTLCLSGMLALSTGLILHCLQGLSRQLAPPDESVEHRLGRAAGPSRWLTRYGLLLWGIPGALLLLGGLIGGGWVATDYRRSHTLMAGNAFASASLCIGGLLALFTSIVLRVLGDLSPSPVRGEEAAHRTRRPGQPLGLASQHAWFLLGFPGAVLLLLGLGGSVWLAGAYRRTHSLPAAAALVGSLLVAGLLALFAGLILRAIWGLGRELGVDRGGQEPRAFPVVARYWPLIFLSLPGMLGLLLGLVWNTWGAEIGGLPPVLATARVSISLTLFSGGTMALFAGITIHSMREILLDMIQPRGGS